MKTVRDFRNTNDFDPDDMQRGTKLAPVKKSGKERRNYDEYDEDDEYVLPSQKRESVFDYFDDGEDEE